MELEYKYEKLKDNIRTMGSLAVAFSGGVDSTFLLITAYDLLKENVLSITVCSAFFPDREYDEALNFVRKFNIRHKIVSADVLDIKEIQDNPTDRCYRCKLEIFKKITETACEENICYVADGSNVDDLSDYRPGMRALNELKVVSPLKDAGLNKSDIRILSKKIGLATWDKPSYACLASRIPYGHKITKDKLVMVDRAEQHLWNLGFKQIRVRHHGDIARIEVGIGERMKFFDEKVMDTVYRKFKEIGFSYAALDLQGYRTGSLNEVILI